MIEFIWMVEYEDWITVGLMTFGSLKRISVE